jgi:hypothetical protein
MIILITYAILVEKYHTMKGISIQTRKAIPGHKNKPIEFYNHGWRFLEQKIYILINFICLIRK